MTEQPITPPPHLLKQFSEQARVDSSKRGGSGYLKTFARFCIEWAMGQLDAKPTPNPLPIRSSEITPTPELVQQWGHNANLSGVPHNDEHWAYEQHIATRAAQWGADIELEACCEWLHWQNLATHSELIPSLRSARRPQPQTLNSIALQMLGTIERDAHYLPEITDTIRRALEALPDD
jgi:hypothetical protein